MRIKRRTLVVAGLLLLVFIALTIARPAPSPRPAQAIPGSFDFAVLGDAPYYPWEELQYNAVLKDLDAHDLAFVIHVGDIFWRPCSDAMYRKTLDGFNSIRHAVIYTPPAIVLPLAPHLCKLQVTITGETRPKLNYGTFA